MNFEAPFLYLLFGREAVLLHDTGTPSPQLFPLRTSVEKIIGSVLSERGQETIRRIVTHSHGHGDHVLGDGQFSDLPQGSIAPSGVAGVSDFFGCAQWPLGKGGLELGDRRIDALPAPGHAEDHVVLFDRSRGLLLTGDLLYPRCLDRPRLDCLSGQRAAPGGVLP